MLGSPPESGRSEGRITSPQLASKFGKARVRFGSIVLKKSAAGAVGCGAAARRPVPSGRCGGWLRDQLGHFPQVLGGGGEEELVPGAAGTSKSQSVELQDAFEVGE